MPNYCLNRLRIRPDSDYFVAESEHFIAAHDGVLSFAKLVPLGQEWSIDHAIERWGTKWDTTPVPLTLDTRFETAWTPPTKWLRSVANLYPDLRFTLEYYEPGLEFRGIIHACGVDYNETRFESIERCVLCDDRAAILWTAEGNWRRCFECQGLPDDTPYFDVINGYDE